MKNGEVTSGNVTFYLIATGNGMVLSILLYFPAAINTRIEILTHLKLIGTVLEEERMVA